MRRCPIKCGAPVQNGRARRVPIVSKFRMIGKGQEVLCLFRLPAGEQDFAFGGIVCKHLAAVAAGREDLLAVLSAHGGDLYKVGLPVGGRAAEGDLLGARSVQRPDVDARIDGSAAAEDGGSHRVAFPVVGGRDGFPCRRKQCFIRRVYLHAIIITKDAAFRKRPLHN